MIKGFVEIVRPFQIRGWALDTADPARALEVSAMIGDAELARMQADIHRDDLLAVGAGNGRHGFVLNLPAELTATEQDALSVVVRDGAVDLTLRRLQPPSRPAEPAEHPPRPADAFDGVWQASDSTHRPVFILGSARSGTSAVAQALLTSTRYVGQEEGQLLDVMPALLRAIDTHYQRRGEEWSERPTMIASVPQHVLVDGCRHVVIELARRLFPEGRWLDKTPRGSMTEAAPLLRSIWPEARFVFMKRRGIDNVASRMRKFPSVPFAAHVEDWRLSMQSWSRAAPALGGAALEIDQLHLAREPAGVARQLARLLGLAEDETERLAVALATDRPEQTSADFSSPADFQALDWPDADKELFVSCCDAQMRRFGYAYTSDYFEAGRSFEALRVR